MTEGEKYLAWLGDLFDGEGTFSIQMSVRKGKYKDNIRFNPTAMIGLWIHDEHHIRSIRDSLDFGHLYVVHPEKPTSMLRWQTTNLKDSLMFSEMILPYLRVKREKCVRFIEAVKLLLLAKARRKNTNKHRGGQVFRKDGVLAVVEIATTLNLNRSKLRYGHQKTFEEWKPIVEQMYM